MIARTVAVTALALVFSEALMAGVQAIDTWTVGGWTPQAALPWLVAAPLAAAWALQGSHRAWLVVLLGLSASAALAVCTGVGWSRSVATAVVDGSVALGAAACVVGSRAGVEARRQLADVLPLSVMAALGVGMMARALRPEVAVVVLALIPGIGVLVWRRARATRQALSSDLSALSTTVELYAHDRGWTATDVRLPRTLTHAGRRLSRELSDAHRRLHRVANAEDRAREDATEAGKLKTRFVAMVSHDLRSPLNSITGFADVLAQELDGSLSSEQRASVRAIQDSGEELIGLVTGILDSARLEAGRLEMHPAYTPCAGILADAVALVRRRTRSEPLLRIDISPGLPPIRVDHDRMVQAVAGVLEHVAKMTDPHSEIVLAVSASPAQARIVIESAALEREDESRIFEAFRPVRHPSGGRVAGLGFGLALARGIAVAHGGDLRYEPAAAGASFVFTLKT